MSAIFGETLTFSQENGPDVKLVVFGDEFYARYETIDGYTVVYDIDLKQYCYAILLDGRFASSGVQITKSPPTGIQRHLKEYEGVRNEKFERRYANIRPPERAETLMRTLGLNEGLLEGRRVSSGPVRGLTILVEFADMSTNVTASDVDDLLNGENYNKHGNYCSVNKYFHLMSNGKLNYSNSVVGPIRLSKNRIYYTTDENKTRLLIREALDIVVNDMGIDLSEFDSRSEGIVDALNIMYAGRTVYEGGLWPHNSVINLNYAGIRTHFYMITSLGRYPVDLSIGTFCHENGHQLCRFADLYDYGTRDGDFEKSAGFGVYCLMGCGNHLNRGRTPSPVCSYLRYLVNWIDNEILLNNPTEYQARHGDYGTLMKYETNKLNEFFIVENRSQFELDSHLPDSGLAVYHCDILGSNEWQGGTRDKHYQCGLLQADGHFDLENNRNYGDAGDLFERFEGLALSHDTKPHSRIWDGSDSSLRISDISAPGEIIRFSTGEWSPPLVAMGEVTADLPIPDSEPEGVSSEITISQIGRAKSIKVSIDIIHTFIGELQVELEAPSGKKAMLHDKTGGYTDNIKETYFSDSVQTLADLGGESINGNWTLHIKDLALYDTGRLNWWKIEIKYESEEQVIHEEVTPNLSIPDMNTLGISSFIHIIQEGFVKDIKVNVEISHTFIGDLLVDLVAPSGQSVTLHNRTGNSKNDLRMTYDKLTVPALEAFKSEQIKGDWSLRVRDLAKFDEGKLEKWSLWLMY